MRSEVRQNGLTVDVGGAHHRYKATTGLDGVSLSLRTGSDTSLSERRLQIMPRLAIRLLRDHPGVGRNRPDDEVTVHREDAGEERQQPARTCRPSIWPAEDAASFDLVLMAISLPVRATGNWLRVTFPASSWHHAR
jgi:hypothetical protein